MTMLAIVLLAGGAVLLVIAAWGVLALPDALARQHAATKAGTFALALLCGGAMAAASDAAWTWRLLLILVFLLATLPVGSHLLARAAVREAGLDQLVRNAARAGSAARTSGQSGPAEFDGRSEKGNPDDGRFRKT